MPEMTTSEWVGHVLSKTGWSQAELARQLNLRRPTDIDRSIINKIVLGKRALGADEMILIEDVTGIAAPTRLAAVPVPLISWVSAGDLTAAEAVFELEGSKTVSVHGLDPKGDWIALTVDGDSMNRISPPDSVIFVNRKDRRLVANACYVISDPDTGEASYKRYRTQPLRFEPVSTNPVHEPYFVEDGRNPKIIGRVRKSVLSM